MARKVEAVAALNSVLTEVAEAYVLGDAESRDLAWVMNILQSRIGELDEEAAGEYDQAAIAVAVHSNLAGGAVEALFEATPEDLGAAAVAQAQADKYGDWRNDPFYKMDPAACPAGHGANSVCERCVVDIWP